LDVLFVQEQLRGQGYGQALLTAAEQEAKQRGCKHAFLDTFSFQAPQFHQKRGYRVFGKLLNFPPGHSRYFLQKQL
jgi:GNAT superfamily N-acetyltransferase